MSCLVCDRIFKIKLGQNHHFICETNTSYVVFHDYQFYNGYILVLSKICCSELHFLPQEFKSRFLEDMSIVAKAIYNEYKPVKLNYELLGNKHSHLHWHLIPRYTDDEYLKQPIWFRDISERQSDICRYNFHLMKGARNRVKRNIEKIQNQTKFYVNNKV